MTQASFWSQRACVQILDSDLGQEIDLREPQLLCLEVGGRY